jgi:AAA family ATP:ADP antiporter
VPLTYRFFAANILVFAAALYVAGPEGNIWIGRAFFIWLSIFNLFVVSVFWATIVDVFSAEQGKRLFAFIAAGATLGAIAGSATTAILARDAPTWALLLGAAVLLEVAVFSMRGLAQMSDRLRQAPHTGDAPAAGAIGGSAFAGITRTLRSPYLLNISLFLLLFSITSTFLYFEQAGIAKRSFPDRGTQTAFFASVDLLVNILTLGVQFFLTGRIVRRIGLGPTLALLPAASVSLLWLCRRRLPQLWFSKSCDVPETSPLPGQSVKYSLPWCRARIGTKRRTSSTRWYIGSATSWGPGHSPESPLSGSDRPLSP